MTQKGFEVVAKVADIQERVPLGITLSNGERVCLIRQGTRITAVQDICTHQEFAMSAGDVLADGTIQCAWHGARFDCLTGEVKQVPATEPLPVYEVRIEGDSILVGHVRSRLNKGYEPSVAETAP